MMRVINREERMATRRDVLSEVMQSVAEIKARREGKKPPVPVPVLTFEEFERLPEEEGIRYELDEGILPMEPSPALRHNVIRQRIAIRLIEFVEAHHLGLVVGEMDFRLAPDTVRNPDVAFITAEHLKKIDLDRTPVEGAPALAIEVISPSNLAQDTAKKVQQYLSAGSQSVWLVYPDLQLIEVHDFNKDIKGGQVREAREPATLEEGALFGAVKFSLALQPIFHSRK
jgi:Uma2 family endonuclease